MNVSGVWRKKLKSIPFFFIIVIAFIGNVQAQTPDFKYLGIEKGLSNNAVTSIYQDYNGFMWFGTYDGLNRYDAYGFKIYRNVIGDTASLNSNHITSIEGDEYHNLWIGGQKGVNLFNAAKSNFSPLRYLTIDKKVKIVDDDVNLIKAVKGGYIFVGTQHKGLLVFFPGLKTAIQLPFNMLQGNKSNYDVTAIESNPAARVVYIFIRQIGLCIYDIPGKTLQLLNNSIIQANCLKFDRTGKLWLATDNALYQYDIAANRYSQNFISTKSKIVSVYPDKKNTLWIATDGEGVLMLTDSNKKAVPLLTSLGAPLINSNAVYSIYEDFDGRKINKEF